MKTPAVNFSRYFAPSAQKAKLLKISAKEQQSFNEEMQKVLRDFRYRVQLSRQSASKTIFNI